MKKWSFLALILLVAIVLCCTGCGGGEASEAGATSNAASDAADSSTANPTEKPDPDAGRSTANPIEKPDFDIPNPHDLPAIDDLPEPILEKPGDYGVFVDPGNTTPNEQVAAPEQGPCTDREDDIPSDDIAILIDKLVVEDGTYVICGGKAAFCQYGREVYTWESKTDFSDFLFEIDGEVYAKLNGNIMHFDEESMILITTNVADCEWTGVSFYCYHFSDTDLYYWSPTVDACIAKDVKYVYTTNKHTFYETLDGEVYVVNAYPYAIARVSMDYIRANPVPVVYLGEGPMSDYYSRLEPNSEENARKAATDFDHYYGLDPLVWGND